MRSGGAYSGLHIHVLYAMLVRAASVLVTIAFVSALRPEEWETAWDQAEKKCEQFFKKSDKSLLLTGDDLRKTAKCFVSCFFDSVGLTKGTEINRELYRGWLDEELKDSKNKDSIIASVEHCIDGIDRTEKCNTAFDLYECFGKKYFTKGME